MKTYLNFFGKRINLASRLRRRLFVALFYAIAAAIIYVDWHFRATSSTATIHVIMFWVLAGPFLGGSFYFSAFVVGPVQPFEGNKWLRSPWRGWLNGRDPKDLRSDERDLTRRDRAHYAAYDVLALLVLAALAGYNRPFYHTISMATQQRITLALLEAGSILAFTLPAAILLWTEPDLVPDPAPESGNHPAQPTVRPAP